MPLLKVILGPTAVGKTEYAIKVAEELGSPVISCDSRQIFKEMSVGTAKPTDEQLARVKHFFIGTHSITENYTAGLYEIEALSLLEELFRSHDVLVMAGGSGLYVDALCNGLDDFPAADLQLRDELNGRLKREGVESLRRELKLLDPQSYEDIDIANAQRVVRALEVTLSTGRKFSSFKTAPHKKRSFEIEKVCLVRPREVLYERIDRRVDEMMARGLEEEARSLLPYRSLPAMNTVGYKELFGYFDGEYDLEEATRLIKRNTRHYAKRQMTWWRRDPSIEWIEL
ncbi:MAG: tRNA (adenosine(37)-N6)-dimethylallyltransferase MiaA [Bacteroidales bacterium]|nr:tRNA (adenosine(37)-N6)-dimethylallyltransferase MiaA [Candidatus Cacconaster merdequi]